MAWNPIVPAARKSEQLARMRRFHNKAVTAEATSGSSIVNSGSTTDLSNLPTDAIVVRWSDVAGLGVAVTIGPPQFAGQLLTYSLNKTTGGSLTLSMTRTIQNGGSFYGQIDMSVAGSVVMMQGFRYNDLDYWLAVAAHGATFS